MFCVYRSKATEIEKKKTCLLHMLKSLYNVIEDQKYYYSDPIYGTFN